MISIRSVTACLLACLLASCESREDFESGTRLVFGFDPLDSLLPTDEIQQRSKETIAKRLESYGLRQYRVRAEGEDRVVVEVAGDETTVELVKPVLVSMGRLSFTLEKDGKTSDDELSLYEATERKYNEARRAWIRKQRGTSTTQDSESSKSLPPRPEYVVRKDADGKKFVLESNKNSSVSGDLLKSAKPVFTERGMPAIGFSLNPEGAERMAAITGENIGRRIAFVLDDVVIQSPTSQGRISGEGRITGDFTRTDVQKTVHILRGGALPVPLELREVKAFGKE